MIILTIGSLDVSQAKTATEEIYPEYGNLVLYTQTRLQ